MQFAIIAYDGKDKDALDRRLSAREEHIKLGDDLVRAGNAILGAALLTDGDEMMGSIEIVDFPSQTDVDRYLEREPYVTNGVWQDITVIPCRIGPSYLANLGLK